VHQLRLLHRSTPPEVPAILAIGKDLVSFHAAANGYQVYVSTETPQSMDGF
jgi:hypothetical protein